MAPPRQRRMLELNEDITAKILLLIPPDEPQHLFRASVVCKLWRRVVSDPAFLRRYRTFHRGAPLLGFFCYNSVSTVAPSFVPTTAASSPTQPGHSLGRWVHDCRHGRVLLRENCTSRTFVVWHPFSDHWDELEAPPPITFFSSQNNAVVLCAVPGCDHCNCRRGPFHVVCVDGTNARAHVYSSKSRSWCTSASAQLDGGCRFNEKRAALVGDGIYWIVNEGARILKYDFVEHRLSFIGMPEMYKKVPVLMQNQDGSLGMVGVSGPRLHLWSTMVNADGVTGWVKRVIKLVEVLPIQITFMKPNVISFAEGVDVFFISTNAGAFTFELKSGRVRKVGEPRDYFAVIPFISFFTPDLGCSKWTKVSLPRPNLE